MRIEGFRNLNSDIETIINKSEAVKSAKKNGIDKLSQKDKKELSEAEKEYKTLRKQIQEKLIKFATRIPVFMYLTDYREYTLYEVIHQLEPELFRKVTGLTLQDFDLLVSLGVFNRELMNDAVYKFKRYEDSSLIYTGINTHAGENVGGFDTVISEKTYNSLVPEVNLYEETTTIEESGAIPAEKEERDEMAISDTENNLTIDSDYEDDIESAAPWLNLQVGDRVIHKSWGEGTISMLDDKYMKVKFDVLEKKFLYPSCFEQGFFIIDD